MPKTLQTKCKTCFGGTRMILHALWKNTFFLSKKQYGFFTTLADPPPPGLAKDHKKYGFFSAPFPYKAWLNNSSVKNMFTLTWIQSSFISIVIDKTNLVFAFAQNDCKIQFWLIYENLFLPKYQNTSISIVFSALPRWNSIVYTKYICPVSSRYLFEGLTNDF